MLSSTSSPDGVEIAWKQGQQRAGERQDTPVFFNGTAWSEMAPGSTGKVLDVHVEPGTVWALVSRKVGKVARTVDLLVSRDGGAQWTRDRSVFASTRDRPYDLGDGRRGGDVDPLDPDRSVESGRRWRRGRPRHPQPRLELRGSLHSMGRSSQLRGRHCTAGSVPSSRFASTQSSTTGTIEQWPTCETVLTSNSRQSIAEPSQSKGLPT